MSRVENLFKHTIVPMVLSKVKIFEAGELTELIAAINDWVESSKSVILSVSAISKVGDYFLITVIYMEPSNVQG